MEKLLPIIHLVLTVIAVIVSVITLLTVSGLKANLAENETAQESIEGKEDIPITQQTLYNMEKQFVFSYPPTEDEKKTTNVVVNIGFVLDSEAKDTEDILTQFAEKQGLIRDRIQTMIKEKKENPFKTVESQQEVKSEILTLTQKLFETNSIIDVVFSDVMSSQR